MIGLVDTEVLYYFTACAIPWQLWSAWLEGAPLIPYLYDPLTTPLDYRRCQVVQCSTAPVLVRFSDNPDGTRRYGAPIPVRSSDNPDGTRRYGAPVPVQSSDNPDGTRRYGAPVPVRSSDNPDGTGRYGATIPVQSSDNPDGGHRCDGELSIGSPLIQLSLSLSLSLFDGMEDENYSNLPFTTPRAIQKMHHTIGTMETSFSLQP